MACKLVAAVLRDRGIDSEYVSLENVVPTIEEADPDARSDSGIGALDQSFYDRVAVAVGERIKQCGQRVPVVTGKPGTASASCLSVVI